VTRLGASLSVRLSTEYGLQWWFAPYFFILPGVRVLGKLILALVALLTRGAEAAAQIQADRYRSVTLYAEPVVLFVSRTCQSRAV
jgi:hypothetical protein